MSTEYLVFDLDGTISNPQKGITRSLNYALDSYGFAQHEEADLTVYIGPPLDETFIALVGRDEPALIESLVAKYRERYADIGYAENELYADMTAVLTELYHRPGIKLGVCTSKRKDFADKILKMFDLADMFDFVSGAEIGLKKWQQLEGLLQQGIVSKNSIMIGDRDIDLLAAKHSSISSAAVLWGFGSRRELEGENPDYLLHCPAELLNLV